jgi:cell division protease FtsH
MSDNDSKSPDKKRPDIPPEKPKDPNSDSNSGEDQRFPFSLFNRDKGSGGGGNNQPPNRNMTIFIILGVFTILFLYLFWDSGSSSTQIYYDKFYEHVLNNEVEQVTIKGKEIRGKLRTSTAQSPQQLTNARNSFFYLYRPDEDPKLIHDLMKHGVQIRTESPDAGFFTSLFLNLIPLILIFGVIWFFMFRQVQGTGNKAFSFGKSKAKLARKSKTNVTFKDVAGIDEAIEDVKEIVDFLKYPKRFMDIGARIPRGVLLMGPTGTGKTLLAKAIAGESDSNFFSMSGSDFVEMFVGVGASRVRDLFEQGRKNAPAILFIDEIDAVGRVRGAGYGGGHDEREQTLNQMLVEMDGFDTTDSVIIIGATNRPDVLDPALLRPGRFDRQIVVDRPDIKGRKQILKVHVDSRKIPMKGEIDLEVIARGTPGFTGADLANLVNEAALIAARRNRKKVTMDDFEFAKDKIMMGPERKSMVISDDEKATTAYHEAGHALVNVLLSKMSDPLHKVTIIPRGRALGITMALPKQDIRNYSKAYLLATIQKLLAGRIAEMHKFGSDKINTGASNDIERATHLARSMVCEWGMSETMGTLLYGQKEEPIFIGKEIARHKDYSENTAQLIDKEIKSIIDSCYEQADQMIKENWDKLESLAQALIKKETLTGMEVAEILGVEIEQSADDEQENADNSDQQNGSTNKDEDTD